MTAEQAVYQILTSTAAVTALLGTRIHPSQQPQSTVYPSCVYQDASRKTLMTFDGPRPTDKYGMRLDVYGSAYGSVKAAAKAVRDTLLGFRGVVGGALVMGIFDENEEDSLDQPIHDEERGIFSVGMDLVVWFRGA